MADNTSSLSLGLNNLEIIDAHVHLVPTIEDEELFFPRPGRRKCNRWANPRSITSYLDFMHISKIFFLVLVPRNILLQIHKEENYVPGERKPKKLLHRIKKEIIKINTWACSIKNPRIIPFICLSDCFETPDELLIELELRIKQGAKGVKFHPGLFMFYPYDKLFFPLYEYCNRKKIPIIFDTAPWPNRPEQYDAFQFGRPIHFEKILEAFPTLRLILGHLGAAWWDERMDIARRYDMVYVDTSQGFIAPDRISIDRFRGLSEYDAPRVFKKLDTKRILFGSDFPGIDAMPQIDQILRLEIDDQVKECILSKNADNLLAEI